MAKIFRRIREKLLAENRLRKYLLYALGEIILVVVGILIALQINGVNQDRQRAKMETVLLGQMKFELQEAYADIWRDAGVLAMGDNAHETISRYITEDKAYVDSLCFHFYWLMQDEYVYPTSASYTRIKEVGLDIIQNDSIRIYLQSLFEGYFPRLDKNNSFTPDISAAFNDYYLTAFRPNTDTQLRFSYPLADDTIGTRIYADVSYEFPRKNQHGASSTVGYVPLDFEALKKDPQFLMLLEQTQRYRTTKRMHYAAVRNTIKDVVRWIEEELEEEG